MLFGRSIPMVLSLVVLVGCGGGEDKPSTPSAPSPDSTSKSTSKPATPAKKPAVSAEDIAEGWGSLKGRFVYGGDPVAAASLTVTTDKEYCGKHELSDESVVVNAKNKGLANVVVFLYLKRDEAAPTAHESYAAAANEPVTLDNHFCRFEPHVCLLQTSQKLIVKNSDTVGHNTNISPEYNPSFNQTIPVNDSVEVEFEAAERRPVPVNCNIHPWMKGWILPQQTPYFAATNADGEFEIQNLPSGVWTFQVWHEAMGGVDNVTVGGETTKWSKGRLELAIRPDEATDLGEVTIAPDEFK